MLVDDVHESKDAHDGKRCPKCSSTKSASEFYRKARNKDGLQSWCKSCQQKDEREKAACRTLEKITLAKAAAAAAAIHGKACSRCNGFKPLADYKRRPDSLDGHDGQCKSCSALRVKAANDRYRAAHVDMVRKRTSDLRAERGEQYRRNRRVMKKHQSMQLDDTYIAKLLTRYTYSLRASDLPQELIEAKKVQLQIQRTLRGEE